MVNIAQAQPSRDLFPMWQDILGDLVDVFDPRDICAAFSSYTAEHTGGRALTALADDDGKFYDVWISESDGSTTPERWPANESGIDNLLTDQAIQLDKLDRPASEIISSRLWLQARHKLIVAPVIQRDQLHSAHSPAMIALLDPSDNGVITLNLVEQIGNLLRLFLDRAALRAAADRHAAEFAVISNASQALSTTLDIQEIYQLLGGPIRQTLNVATLSIGLVESVSGDIIFVEDLMGPMFKHLPPVRLKRGQGIAGWVVDNKKPAIINNPYSDKRFFPNVDQSSGFSTRSMICIPLMIDDHIIGVLQAINRQSGEFTDHDLQLMLALGGPLAAAIENAGLHAEVLAESQRIKTLFAQIADGLVVINRNGIINQANSAFSNLLGEDETHMTGSSLYERLHIQREELDALVAQAFDSTGGLLLAVDLTRSDGRVIPVVINGAVVTDEAGNAEEAILIFSDVTQIREVERMRDDLFEGITQELRTPLATILMYSRLLREGKARQLDKAERFLGVIERESDRLQRMIRQMLDIARIDMRELQRGATAVELDPIFESSLPPFAERAVHKGLFFRQRVASGLSPVTGNAELIELVLSNLLDNAIKFSPSGNIQVTVRQEEENVVIEVSDEGIGIPPQSMPHLFKRFYRAQNAIDRGFAGNGLGLTMVKDGLEKYNGKIVVQSRLGEGSLFTVRLPIAHS